MIMVCYAKNQGETFQNKVIVTIQCPHVVVWASCILLEANLQFFCHPSEDMVNHLKRKDHLANICHGEHSEINYTIYFTLWRTLLLDAITGLNLVLYTVNSKAIVSP